MKKRRTQQTFFLFRTNFTQIALKSEEFLDLELQPLIELLQADELNVKSEEVVFDALIRWIDHQVDQRKQVKMKKQTIEY